MCLSESPRSAQMHDGSSSSNFSANSCLSGIAERTDSPSRQQRQHQQQRASSVGDRVRLHWSLMPLIERARCRAKYMYCIWWSSAQPRSARGNFFRPLFVPCAPARCMACARAEKPTLGQLLLGASMIASWRSRSRSRGGRSRSILCRTVAQR
ncbi:hypothetical protein BCV70DRAFT_42909 [Testicularia cyperi]|uniref:Uncharacterized protein n=1 Tax=Testicularia cyperi TaxID=1882483 RepID=A0A317XJ96_9BASI|nr:hypothetical protein BCV70DRAFT_42909 [Testicularia cyperi]